MSKQDSTQAPVSQCPTKSDPEAWKAYWTLQSQPWRTDPEIGTKRQEELAQRCAIVPDIEKGIYPFKGMKLSRADIEWLLATHENGHGPVDWSDKGQRERIGLDLRGADLCNVDLSYLPLAHLHGGLTFEESSFGTLTVACAWQATLHLDGASLAGAHLEGAILNSAHLEGALLDRVHLEGADLKYVRFGRAQLPWVYLEGANLYAAHLEGANLRSAHLEGAILENMLLADERYTGPLLADAEWGNSNLSVVKWSQIHILGDEFVARQKKHNGEVKEGARRLEEYEMAVRAYHQLSVALRNQGLNEDATRFAYRAQLLQRRVFRIRGGIRSFGQYLSSLLLDLLAGYGYKPWRSFLAYLIVITAFATTYFFIGRTVGPVLSPLGSFVFSMTSFHGRGFFPGDIGLDDPLTVLAALEAFVGLLIEVTFIATLTQRLFGR